MFRVEFQPGHLKVSLLEENGNFRTVAEHYENEQSHDYTTWYVGVTSLAANSDWRVYPGDSCFITGSNPERPEDPADPVDPVEPVEPVEPVDPIDPIEPVDPDEPIDPLPIVDPWDPQPLPPVEPASNYCRYDLFVQ